MEKKKKVVSCPNCGLQWSFSKLKAGHTVSIPCLAQWDRSIGCGYVISVNLSEKKYGEK